MYTPHVLFVSLRSSDKLLLGRSYTSLVMADKAFSVRARMTCLLTVALQLVSIVLNAVLNANSFTSRTLITPSNSRLSRLRFRFFLLGLIGALQIGFVFLFVFVY